MLAYLRRHAVVAEYHLDARDAILPVISHAPLVSVTVPQEPRLVALVKPEGPAVFVAVCVACSKLRHFASLAFKCGVHFLFPFYTSSLTFFPSLVNNKITLVLFTYFSYPSPNQSF